MARQKPIEKWFSMGFFCAVYGDIGKDKPIPIAPPLPPFTTFLLHLLLKQNQIEKITMKIVVQESIVTGHFYILFTKIIYFLKCQKGGAHFAFSWASKWRAVSEVPSPDFENWIARSGNSKMILPPWTRHSIGRPGREAGVREDMHEDGGLRRKREIILLERQRKWVK